MNEKISTLREISGLDEEDALALLRSNDWNLQVAINEFLTNPQGVRKRKSTRETPKSTDVSSASNDVSSSVSREETSRETGGQSPQGNSRENSGLFGLIATGINTLMRMLKWALTFVFGKDHVKAISGSTSANEFKRFFESEYGTVHPPFFIGSYSQLLEKGKRESNWILIAFYAPDHPGNTDFFKDIIASSQLKGFLSRKKGLFWVGDLRTEEGIKGIVSRVLSVSQHPFLAIIAPQNSKMMIFDRIQEETMYKLTQGISKLESLLEGVRNERAADRSIREQQDEAYLASLKADQEKERLARIEREQKENEEKEANQREQLRLDKLEEKKRRKEYLRNNLPQEPKDAEDISKLSIRLPSGQRLVRVFRATSLVREVYEFAEAQDLSPLPLESDFVLVKPFPRVILEDLDISLNSCGLTNASLIVEEKL